MDALARDRVLALAGIITPRVEYRDVEEFDDVEADVDEEVDEGVEDEEDEDLDEEDEADEDGDDLEDEEADEADEAEAEPEAEPVRSAADRDRLIRLLPAHELRLRQSDNTGVGGSGSGPAPKQQDSSKHPHVASGPKGGQFTSKGGGGSKAAPKAAPKAAGPSSVPQAPATPRTMKPGDSGEDVRYAQYAMSLLGFHVNQSGSYDAQTAAAVKEIQSRLGMKKPNGHLSAAQLHKLQDAVRLSPCVGQSRSFGQDLGETRELGDDIESRHRALVLLGIPVRALPPDDDNTIDDATRSILDALDEWVDRQVEDAWDERAHDVTKELRIPGGKGGGRWTANPVGKAISDALEAWGKGKGPDDPFTFDGKPIDREPLRRAAVARGITLKRGASRDDIVHALLGGVRDEVKTQRAERQKRLGSSKFSIDVGGKVDPEAAREVEVENHIRAAYAELLAEKPNGASRRLVSLADLRDRLGEENVRGADVDMALKRMITEPGVNLIPESNQSDLTPRLRSASARIGGQDKHHITIADPSPRPMPTPVGGKKIDVAVYTGTSKPDAPVLREVSSANRPGRVITSQDDLAGLEKWANDNGHTDVAEWAKSERARAEAKSAPRTHQTDTGGRITEAEAWKRMHGDKPMPAKSAPKAPAKKAATKAAKAAPKAATPAMPAAKADAEAKFRTEMRKLSPPFGPDAKQQWDDARLHALGLNGRTPEQAVQQLEADIAANEARLREHEALGIEPHLQRRTMQALPDDIERQREMARLIRKTFGLPASGLAPKHGSGPTPVPVRAVIKEGAGSDPSTWTATGFEGLPQSDRTAAAAVTRYLQRPAFMNDRLRNPDKPLHDQSLQELTTGVVDTEKAAAAARTADRQIAAIDKVMEQSHLTAPMTTYRGTRLADIGVPDGNAVGHEWTDPGFASTSAGRGVAEHSFSGPGAALLTVHSPAGTPALQIDGLGESEVLLGRGQTYRAIADHGTLPNGARHLEVEVVPKSPAKAAPKVDAHQIAADPSLTDRQKRSRLKSAGVAPEEVDRLVPTKTAAKKAAPKAAKAAPKADAPSPVAQLSPADARQAEFDNRLRKVHAELTATSEMTTPYVSLRRLRPLFADMSKAEFDAAIKRFYFDNPDVSLEGEVNQKVMTPADWAAGVKFGGEDHHLLGITKPKQHVSESPGRPNADQPVKKAAKAALPPAPPRTERTDNERFGPGGKKALPPSKSGSPRAAAVATDPALTDGEKRTRLKAMGLTPGQVDALVPPAGGARPKGEGGAPAPIDRSKSPAEVIQQESAAKTAALAAPPVKLQEMEADHPRSAGTRALTYYQHHGDQHMNGLLRTGKVGAPEGTPQSKIPSEDKVRASIATIDAQMEQSRLAEPIVTYRGMSDVAAMLGGTDSGSFVGRTFSDQGYASTSADRVTAMDFLAGEGMASDGALMELLVPRGTGAIQISDDQYRGPGAQPGWDSEREILLQRGLRYRVVSDEMRPTIYQDPRTGEAAVSTGTGSTYRHLVVEVLPPEVAS